VAEGDLDRPIEPTGPPELASLGRDIEGMRRRLRDEADELRQVRETLAERSPLQLLLRSELEATPDTSDFSVAGRLLPAEGVLGGGLVRRLGPAAWGRGGGSGGHLGARAGGGLVRP